jgi:hypothetical protein
MDLKMNQEQQITKASGSTQACSRAEELISYLYQETSAAEALDFEQHMRGCVSCRSELEEFGIVRESIGEWRAQALGGLFNSTDREASPAAVFEASKAGPTRQRSALAAIREFFTLSPGWMRGATAFAGLAFCALAVIAFAHFYEHKEAQTVSVEKPSDKVYTKQQVDEMLAQVRQESSASKQVRADRLDQESRKSEVAIASSSSTNTAARPAAVRKSATVPSPALAKAATIRRGSNNISTRERQQLAEVLLPQETRDEEKLPRLSDLLGNDAN